MTDSIPVIDLANAPGERGSWGRHKGIVYLWGAFELIFVSNPWQISSRLRIAVLRLFGADIGHDVIFRPRTRVRFPWKLHVGDRAWIGEGVWIHNQDLVTVGHDAVISQEAFITTGSHAHRRDMALVTRAVVVEPGAWITARAVVLGGTTVGRSSILSPNSVAGPNQLLVPGAIYSGNPAQKTGDRL